MQKLQEINK